MDKSRKRVGCKGLFSYGGDYFYYMEKIFDTAALNLLWLLFCLPVITIGASTTALYDTVHKQGVQDEGYVVKVFFSILYAELQTFLRTMGDSCGCGYHFSAQSWNCFGKDGGRRGCFSAAFVQYVPAFCNRDAALRISCSFPFFHARGVDSESIDLYVFPSFTAHHTPGTGYGGQCHACLVVSTACSDSAGPCPQDIPLSDGTGTSGTHTAE